MQQETEVKNIHQQISELLNKHCNETGICVKSIYVNWFKKLDKSESIVAQVEVTSEG